MVQFHARSNHLVAALFAVLLAVMLPGQANADAAWKSLQGHSACGGIDANGRLQPSCGFAQATYIKQSIKSCPQGAFADLGTCWKCPDGFGRALFTKIDSDRACSKPAPPTTARATLMPGGKCPSGAIFDIRNGGECWRCDAGFGRTAAAVNEWNACGKAFEKARSATFVGRACPAEGTFRDPRNGGECWKCPEGYDRTASAVTAANACKTTFAFSPAIPRGDLACGPGEFFDFIDGGTCWSCPNGYKRTWDHVKANTACRNDKMQWVMPKRQLYGIFGLGAGAEEILAKLIAERTEIDAFVTNIAVLAGENPATARQSAWEVIDSKPWESPYLPAVLAQTVMNAAKKPISQRTEAEKDVIARVAQYIQWNRQFVAHQARQAHETWVRASKASYDVALSKMGAAAVYADSMVTPPDYNEVLVGSIQMGAGFAGPVAVILLKSLVVPVGKAMAPYAAQAAGTSAAGAWSTSSVAIASAAGPAVIAMAAAVIVTMEIDKFIALERAAGQIQQSIAISERPVDIGVLLQQKNGVDDFLFHWAAVFGAATRPSANFNARLAFYKTGKAPATGSSPSLPDNIKVSGTVHQKPPQPQIEVQLHPIPTTQAAAQPATVPNPEDRIAKAIQQDVARQPRTAPPGAMRIEGSHRPGLCIAKKAGLARELAGASCADRQALWIVEDTTRKVLMAATQYCLLATAPTSGSAVVVAQCSVDDNGKIDNPRFNLQLTQQGMIHLQNTDQCLTLGPNMDIVLQTCGSQPPMQTWRPWAGR